MIPLLRRYLFTIIRYKHSNCPSIIVLYITFVMPLFRWYLITISSYMHCHCLTVTIFNIRIVFPLFRRNKSMISQPHSKSYTSILLQITSVFPLFIWYFTSECLQLSHCISSIILNIWIMVPLFWNIDIIFSQYHCDSKTIFILFIWFMSFNIGYDSKICLIKYCHFLFIFPMLWYK